MVCVNGVVCGFVGHGDLTIHQEGESMVEMVITKGSFYAY